jgi:hypothetical protein
MPSMTKPPRAKLTTFIMPQIRWADENRHRRASSARSITWISVIDTPLAYSDARGAQPQRQDDLVGGARLGQIATRHRRASA